MKNDIYDNHWLSQTIQLIRDQIDDLWSWDSENDDQLNLQISNLSEVLERLALTAKDKDLL